MKQIRNYKILADLFETSDFKPIDKYDRKMGIFFNSINGILSEMKLYEPDFFNFSTLFDSKYLCFKYHRFILNYLEYYQNVDKISDNDYNFCALLCLINNQSNCSEDFCIAFHEYKLASSKNGIEIMFSLLEKTSEQDFLDSLVGGLHNMSKLNFNYNEIWQDKLEIIKSLAMKCDSYENSSAKILCFLMISLLANDDEMKKISVENTQIILSIIDELKAVTDNILKKNYKRDKIELNKEIIEVASNYKGFFLIEVN